MDLSVEVERCAGATLAVIAGEVEMVSVPQLTRRLNEIELGEPPVLILDMRGVTFLDSSGLSTLVSWQRQLRDRGGQLRVVCGARIHKLFRVTNMDQVLRAFADVDAALQDAVNAS